MKHQAFIITCPVCAFVHNTYTPIFNDNPPKLGVICVCTECESILQFREGKDTSLDLFRLTDEDLLEMDLTKPGFKKIIYAIVDNVKQEKINRQKRWN